MGSNWGGNSESVDATEPTPPSSGTPDRTAHVDLSIVVIGFNESDSIGACLESARNSTLPENLVREVIYVDGGSRDNSCDIARAIPGVRVLGGDRPRRAAENRNLGFQCARGRFIQFVDGDMVLDSAWMATALDYLNENANVGVVYGRLREVNPGRLYQAMQHDWAPVTGEVAYCGGAAMHRREVLEKVGGFPEDVRYGEEPYMCWRIRREQGVKIVQLDAPMALHDLGHRSLRDYWRQNVRNGTAFVEIATRCFHSDDKLWSREVLSIVGWDAAILIWAIALGAGPSPVKIAALALLALVLARKAVQARRAGMTWDVCAVYALHTYAAKVPLGWGLLKWLAQWIYRGRQST